MIDRTDVTTRHMTTKNMQLLSPTRPSSHALPAAPHRTACLPLSPSIGHHPAPVLYQPSTNPAVLLITVPPCCPTHHHTTLLSHSSPCHPAVPLITVPPCCHSSPCHPAVPLITVPPCCISMQRRAYVIHVACGLCHVACVMWHRPANV